MEQCLFSVLKAIKNIDAEIIVVDNHSSDESATFFNNRFREVTFFWNERNVGFARANNQALKKASGDYVLFLNPDTIVPEDCFEKCLSFIRSQNNHCALGIKMLDGSGNFLKESKRSFPSPITSLYKIVGLARLFPHSKTFARYHLGNLSNYETHEVDVLAGAFMMMPKKILDITGGFDETFFMYGEDIDLSFRIQEAGFKNFYFAESTILHFKGESTKKGSLNYVKLFYRAMSVFVKKHYGNASAGIFNFLIQTAIFLRACLAAVARFLKWISLPAIDAAIILMSFWIIKIFWSTFIKPGITYSPNLLLIAFPVFTALFLASSYFSGLYDLGFKQSRLNKATLTAILVILSVYSLFPEELRLSRGILLFGSLLAFILMILIRHLLLQLKVIESQDERREINRVIIAGTMEELLRVSDIIKRAGKEEGILEGIVTDDPLNSTAPATFNEFKDVLHLHAVKEIIFCEGFLSFKKIIEITPGIPRGVHIKFIAEGSNTIIGSDDKGTGNVISIEENNHLGNPVYRRAKSLFDVIVALIFLLFSPVHLFISKKPIFILKNSLLVLTGKKTWVGYSCTINNLPGLKPGVITTTGLPVSLNFLSPETLILSDKLYAKHYKVLLDVKLVCKNYRLLSCMR